MKVSFGESVDDIAIGLRHTESRWFQPSEFRVASCEPCEIEVLPPAETGVYPLRSCARRIR
jgi:hypothetical protein